MKKTIKSIILITIISFFLIGVEVKAASANLTTSTNNVIEGDTFTATVQVSSAAWHVVLTSSGPVENCSINRAGESGSKNDTNTSYTATCTTTGPGDVILTLSGDISTYNESLHKIETTPISGTATVTVSEKQEPEPSPSPSPSPSPTTTPSSKPREEKDKDKVQDTNKSTNNNVKEITVDGTSATKVDDTHYTATVGEKATSVVIKATPEDSKAKVSGTGTKELKKGENKFEIIVTSESGSKNTITLTIKRRESTSLENIEEALKDNNTDTIDIIIKEDSKVTKEILDKIKESKKTVIFSKYDSKNQLEYSWEINGQKLDENSDFDTRILNSSSNEDRINTLVETEDNLIVSIQQTGKLPTGTKLRIYVGDKYSDDEKVIVYYYDEEKDELQMVVEQLKVENGYIEFITEKGSDYVITKDERMAHDHIENDNNLIIILTSIVAGIIIVGCICIVVKKSKKKNGNLMDPEIIGEMDAPIDNSPKTQEELSPVVEEPQPIIENVPYQENVEQPPSIESQNQIPTVEEKSADSRFDFK